MTLKHIWLPIHLDVFLRNIVYCVVFVGGSMYIISIQVLWAAK